MSRDITRFRWVMALSAAAIVAIFILSLWLNRETANEESFVGSDSIATSYIEEANPDYTPWFSSLFSPGSGEIESGLFAMQAALGAGIFGFTLGALGRRRGTRNRDYSLIDASSCPQD